MSASDLIMLTFLVVLMFIMTRNISSRMEMKRLAREEGLVEHHEDRRWVKILRKISVGMGLVCFGAVGYALFSGKLLFLSDNLFTLCSIGIVFLFLGIAPFDFREWVLTEKGVYVYNAGQFIPWGQIITTGILKKRGGDRVVLQIKKEQGEFLKAQYQYLGMGEGDRPEDISDMIRQFIHALDRKKLFKKTKEERQVSIQERKWY